MMTPIFRALAGVVCCSAACLAEIASAGGVPTGACCFVTTVTECTETDEATCAIVFGGLYQGDGTSCSGNPCGGISTGACCDPSGNCLVTTADDCQFTIGGTYFGDGSTCQGVTCPVFGACCFGFNCVDGFMPGDCVAQGGQFQGGGSTCVSVFCNPPIGACCLSPFGGCVPTDAVTCRDVYNGFYRGDNTDCEICPPPEGACCFGNACENFLSQSSCQFQGGVWQGAGSTCNTHPCFRTGACCTGVGQCVDGVTDSDCSGMGGQYQGDDTSCGGAACPASGGCCAPGNVCYDVLTSGQCFGTYLGDGLFCAPQACCPPDLNSDGVINTADLVLMLGVFGQPFPGGGQPADINRDGEVNTADLVILLGAFGTTCP